MILASGKGLLIVKALCEFPPDANHAPIAQSLASYAATHGYLSKATSLIWSGRPIILSDHIGVALIRKHPDGSYAGYRCFFPIRDLAGKEPDVEQPGAQKGAQSQH